ncbi:MAG: hypothetical protein AB8G96_03465 [Phycisphaerales bacterium]
MAHRTSVVHLALQHLSAGGRCAAVGLAAIAAIAAPAAGQDASPPPARGAAPPTTDAPATDAAAPTGPATATASDAAAKPAVRYPLIREGSRLVRVRGRIDTDPATAALRMTIDAADPQSPGHQLVMLPSSRLSELELVLAAFGDRPVDVQVTGRVTIFDGRNFLMLTHPATAIPPDAATPETPGRPDPADDSAEAISRALDRAAGPSTRRPDRRVTEPPPRDGVSRSTTDRTATGRGDSADDGRVVGTLDVAELRPEGTRIVDRRGKVRRTGGGGYLFVFDADGTGDAAGDPPMMMLPCRLLESLGRLGARPGDDAAVLISGEVSTYRGRNYLMPTVYRRPRDQTQLRP